jgi:hypothetical protein
MASYAWQERWARTKEYLKGLFLLAVLLILFRNGIASVATNLYSFLELTWVAWAPLIAASTARRYLNKRPTKNVSVNAALKLLPPVIWGLWLMLILEFVFAIFNTFFKPETVRKVENFLLDVRDMIRDTDAAISHWWIVIPGLFILFYVFSDFTAMERYLKVKQRLAVVGVVLLTMTSLTFLSVRPLNILGEWEYEENLRFYELSLRNEQKAVSDIITCKALSREIKNLAKDTKKDYLWYFTLMRSRFPKKDSPFATWAFLREPSEKVKIEMIDDQVDNDLSTIDSSLSMRNKQLSAMLEHRNPFDDSDTLPEEATRFSPKESATLGNVALSSDIRRKQREMLDAQQKREQTLETYAEQRRELLITAFSDVVGSSLIKAEDLSGEYMKEVISAFSEHLYDTVVKQWYEHHDRLTVSHFLTAIDAIVPPSFIQTIRSLRITGIPSDVEAKTKYAETLEKEADDRIKKETEEQQRTREEMKRLEEQDRERRER